MPTLPMSSYKWLFFYVLLWIGCNPTLQKPPNKDAMPIADTVSTRFPPNVYWVNTGGLVDTDSFRLDSLGNDLFQDRKGNVYFKTYDAESFPVLISRRQYVGFKTSFGFEDVSILRL
jgi:hypothetical protein